ncbi:hypothetical protein [Acidithiobacillus ferriphilus]|jgi:uncharacterized low-complexity protein|nr:hypothetical protein [Acidithiobacillus ferriphilus]
MHRQRSPLFLNHKPYKELVMKQNFVWSVTLGSAFAVTLGALPLTAIAADAAAPQILMTAQPAAMPVSAKSEGHCVSAAMIKAHDGKCGKAYMMNHKKMPM